MLSPSLPSALPSSISSTKVAKRASPSGSLSHAFSGITGDHVRVILGGAVAVLTVSCGLGLSMYWWRRRAIYRAVQRSIQLRTQGNTFYKALRYDEALTKYLLAQDCLALYAGSSESVADAREKAQLNCIIVYLDQGRFRDAIRACNCILSQRSGELRSVTRAKALFRRGRAHEEIGEFGLARDDFKAAQQICPADVDIQTALERVEKVLENTSS